MDSFKDEFDKATNEFVSAINENQRIHSETLNKDDPESLKRYRDSYARVDAAETAWKLLFRPGASEQ